MKIDGHETKIIEGFTRGQQFLPFKFAKAQVAQDPSQLDTQIKLDDIGKIKMVIQRAKLTRSGVDSSQYYAKVDSTDLTHTVRVKEALTKQVCFNLKSLTFVSVVSYHRLERLSKFLYTKKLQHSKSKRNFLHIM
jgi:hypothetical protein